ncbi:hypothetical protein [Rubricoccus marinus]|uniref:Uncharacterized protein n=1 Tax=Rubricoccus marinus TaxID=716817 RepID=A0A259TXD7_9BACT|nr:hypothetical protein [Rubricoccus marinus]OZC02218.1 hypothetical protein BSZ36_03980 [Rubricoccus marinus]
MGYAWGSFHKHPDYRRTRRRSAVATEQLQAALREETGDERPLAPEASAEARAARERYLGRRRSRQRSGRLGEALTSLGLVLLVVAVVLGAIAKLGWI